MIRIHSSLDNSSQNVLKNSISNFYLEIEEICDHNGVSDFQDWFSERTFVSIFINAQIRRYNERVSAIQEYIVREEESRSVGRCDALLTVNRSLFLIESKWQNQYRQVGESHWCMKSWCDYDNKVLEQLKWYVNAERQFYIDDDRYDNVFLQTLIFKVIECDKDQHLQSAETKLNISGDTFDGRGWYYACAYPSAIQSNGTNRVGIEVYGSLQRIKPASYNSSFALAGGIETQKQRQEQLSSEVPADERRLRDE